MHYSDDDFHTDAFQANYSNEEGNLFEAQHTFGLSADVDDGGNAALVLLRDSDQPTNIVPSFLFYPI